MKEGRVKKLMIKILWEFMGGKLTKTKILLDEMELEEDLKLHRKSKIGLKII